MNSLIIASQMNKHARAHYEKYFNKLKELIGLDVGSIYREEYKQGKKLEFIMEYAKSSWISSKRGKKQEV